MKTIDDHFTDWESDVFGYGYGTGEPHTLASLRAFMLAIPDTGQYDYRSLESILGPSIAWLLINVLCHADVIEYGSSPRFAWLTPRGKLLHDYIVSKTTDELCNVVSRSDGYIPCYPNHCNCDKHCLNPFWDQK